MAIRMSKKRKLNEVLTREIVDDGYSGIEVRVTPMREEIIIRATRIQNVLGLAMVSWGLLWKVVQRS